MVTSFLRLLLAAWLLSGLAKVQAQGDDESVGVTFLKIDDATRGIMEEWPPSPLDFAVLFLNLQSQQPALVCVTTPLSWPGSDAPPLQVLKKQIKILPIVAGMVLDANAVSSATKEELNAFARLTEEDAPYKLPVFKGVANRPSHDLCTASQLGFTEIDFGPAIEITKEGFAVPLIARAEAGGLLISLPLLTAIKLLKLDLTSIQWHDQGTLYLTESLQVPHDEQGYFHVSWEAESRVNHVSVASLSPTSEDPLPILDSLQNHCVVLGFDGAGARQYIREDATQISYGHLMALTVSAILTSTITESPSKTPAEASPEKPKPQVMPEAKPIETPLWSEHPDFGLWVLGRAIAAMALLAFISLLVFFLSRKKAKTANSLAKNHNPDHAEKSGKKK